MYLTLFSLSGIAALAWLMLIFLPSWRITRKLAEIEIFPVYLALLYVAGIVPLLAKTGLGVIQDFGTAEGVIKLLAQQDIALIAWIHILAFDQVVGFLIYRDNMQHKYIPLPLQSVILFFTLMFGPVGYLTYYFLRLMKKRSVNRKQAADSDKKKHDKQRESKPAPKTIGAAFGLLITNLQQEKALFINGVIGILLGLISVVVKLFHGPLIAPEGVVQKAISFDLAVGIYVLTLALFLPLTNFSERGRRRWRHWHIALTYLAYGIENVQIARGLDPRFSTHGTPIDNMIGGIFFLIASTLVVLFVIMAIRIFRKDSPDKNPILLATKYAFATTIFAFAAGMWMSLAGRTYFGAANIMILHGIGFHGLQTVPIVALMLLWAKTAVTKTDLIIHIAGASWMGSCTLVAIQTLLGDSVFDITLLPVLAAVLLAVWAATALYSFIAWINTASTSGAVLQTR